LGTGVTEYQKCRLLVAKILLTAQQCRPFEGLFATQDWLLLGSKPWNPNDTEQHAQPHDLPHDANSSPL
jgi:hypothetical protein